MRSQLTWLDFGALTVVFGQIRRPRAERIGRSAEWALARTALGAGAFWRRAESRAAESRRAARPPPRAAAGARAARVDRCRIGCFCYDVAVNASPPDGRLRELERLARQQNGLQLLVLYGSRARDEAHRASDWDLGYLADGSFDPDALLTRAVRALHTDAVDVVDLARASAQLRYRAARDGEVIFERARGTFASFWLEAVGFWCDAAPVLRAGYDKVLGDLTR